MTRQLAGPGPVPLGGGLRLFSSKAIAWLVLSVVGLLLVDAGVSLYQRSLLEQRQKGKARLQRVALFNLRADMADLTYGPKGTYRLTLSLGNAFPEEPLYVMAPSIQAYVQVGILWKEVPSRPADDQADRVLQLTERRTFEYVFGPTTQEFEELIPGYMHIRFSNAMLVSQRDQPVHDLVDRLDNYYVYLRPQGKNRKSSLRSKSLAESAPLWIPMPPH